MKIKILASGLSVAPQLTPEDTELASAQGFRTIIINRPDGEGGAQPSHQEMTEAAARHGLAVLYIPITPGQISQADVDAFAEALKEAPAPILAYCRTGMRSATLWALTQAGHLSSEDILKTTHAAGYDLSALRPRLEGHGRPADII